MKTPRCHRCVYAGRLDDRPTGLLICANTIEAPGRLREVSPAGLCRRFRARREPPLRLPPPAPPDDTVRYIALTKGRFALVDAGDYDRLMQHKWMALFTCGNWYAWRSEKGKCILMHREIMNPPRGMVVDHINRNGLDNRRENQRVCTYAQNNCNRRPAGKSSPYKGVSWDRTRKKWKATAWHNGESVPIGRYDDERDAARAADFKNVQLHGEYAYLNFPDEWPKERRQQVHANAQTRS